MPTSAPSPSSGGPIEDLRVLEYATGRPARIAGMLLADLGADVVRVPMPDSAPAALTPETVCWDRGKRVAPPGDVSAEALGAADVIIVDAGAARLAELGLDAAAVGAGNSRLVHIWLPPYAQRGEWADLPEDPLLLAALSVVPFYFPADDESPVAPVVQGLTYLHGTLGAAAAVAALIGRDRSGRGQPGIVTGLHAAAALMGTALVDLVGGAHLAPGRDGKGSPNWRLYRCADDRSLFLAALTPEIFFRALEALDRLEVMALPEVAGDWQSILDLTRGRPAVTAALEPVFAAETSEHWQAALRAARVPCAVVQSRADWAAGPVAAGNAGFRTVGHPQLGAVTVPNPPIDFARTPTRARDLAADADQRQPWRGRAAIPAVATAPEVALPLEGLRVVDGTSFVAGPTISAILADFGADVVRIEPPGGDTYRAYSLSFVAVNQRKRGIVVDLKETAGREALHDLLRDTDVYVENLRPAAVADLGLADDGPTPRFPRLVHCSLTAFGAAAAFAGLPGFDPVFQVLSGAALAQGGRDAPVVGGAPVNDAVSGALGALGCLAAVYERSRSGAGQRVGVSLAATASFVQSAEFTTWAGAPPAPHGGPDFRGPSAQRRFYACVDGWVAVAAGDARQRDRLASALGVAELDDAEVAERRFADLSVAAALALLAQRGVPACRVVHDSVRVDDPFLVANGFTHLVELPEGTARLVDHYSNWPQAPQPRPGAYFSPGEHTVQVLGAVRAR